jgi:hypothetical protein
MAKLIPDQALIYEKAGGTLYARYRDPPYNKQPRWVIGYDDELGGLFSYHDFHHMKELAKENKTLQIQLSKTLDLYYILKDK